ncbi:MAG: tetratricopeptide repeat protein [candidate division WOR-3 bacterium]|nr:tetratricopeptide repeat protein [candidate division WOR-3 bacterium]
MRDIKRGVKTEDSFQRTMEKIIKFIVRHRETATWIGIGILAVIFILGYLLYPQEKVKPEAELLYTQAINFINMGRFQEAEGYFLELSEKFGNTRPGRVALYYLGVINYNTARFNEALDFFDKFLSKEKGDPLLTPSALLGAGCSAEGLKDYERALKYYEKIAGDKDSHFYFLGMLALGRVNGILGNTDKAQAILKKLLEQNPPQDIVNDAKFYLGYFNK